MLFIKIKYLISVNVIINWLVLHSSSRRYAYNIVDFIHWWYTTSTESWNEIIWNKRLFALPENICINSKNDKQICCFDRLSMIEWNYLMRISNDDFNAERWPPKTSIVVAFEMNEQKKAHKVNNLPKGG